MKRAHLPPALGTALILLAVACSSTDDRVPVAAGGSGGFAGAGGAGGVATGGGGATGGASLTGGAGSGGAGGAAQSDAGATGGTAGLPDGAVDGTPIVDATTEDAAVETSAASDVSIDSSYPASYKGAPYSDSTVTGGAQKVPGRIQAEYYDVVAGTTPPKGQEGVTFHDTDVANNGAAEKSDAATAYLNSFRNGEPVDITFTHPGWDDTTYNFVPQQALELYVGWTAKDEWLSYTVDVAEAGLYAIDVMYSCNGGGSVEIALDDDPALTSGPITLSDTSKGNNGQAPADHAWHIWNKVVAGGTLALPAGKHLLKLRFTAVGLGINLDWFELRAI